MGTLFERQMIFREHTRCTAGAGNNVSDAPTEMVTWTYTAVYPINVDVLVIAPFCGPVAEALEYESRLMRLKVRMEVHAAGRLTS